MAKTPGGKKKNNKTTQYFIVHCAEVPLNAGHQIVTIHHLNLLATHLTGGLHRDRNASEQGTHEMTMSWCVLSTSPLGLADVIAKGPVMSMRCTRTVRSGTLIMILS